MPSYGDLVDAEPELAERVRAILTAAQNAVIGTLTRDGTPRLSGADAHFHERDLYLWSMPGARKGADLRRDPRVAVHSIPWDSRMPRDGAADVGLADAKVTGRAELVTDAATYASFRTWLSRVRGSEQPDDWDLFRVDLSAVAVVFVDDGRLAVDHWSAGGGRSTTRRG